MPKRDLVLIFAINIDHILTTNEYEKGLQSSTKRSGQPVCRDGLTNGPTGPRPRGP